MSQRKPGGETGAPDTAGKQPAARPPTKNKTLLIVSVTLLVAWLGYLLTLALLANFSR